MKIGSLDIGAAFPCRIVAEISNAHNGSLNRCLRLIDAAMEAGADACKFQCYSASELVTLRGDGPAPNPWGAQGWSMRSLYEKAATPFKWFPVIAKHCADIGLPWWSSCFGRESLHVLEDAGCPAYKVASLDRSQYWLVDLLMATGKPLVVSDPGMPWVDPRVRTLWCPPGYPQGQLDFAGMAGHFGFSYHGTDVNVPCEAVLNGARMVEVHFMLQDDPSELEANVSLTEPQVYLIAQLIRAQGAVR